MGDTIRWKTVFCIWISVLSQAAHAADNDVTRAFSEAKLIAMQLWHVTSADLRFVAGQDLAVTRDGTILAGRAFADRITTGLSPSDAKISLRFAMLHEFVHIVQGKDIPDVSPTDTARRPFECQADMLAAGALLDSLLTGLSLDTGAQRATAILNVTHLLKQLGTHGEGGSPPPDSTLRKMGERERALAVQFGFIRSMEKWSHGSKETGQKIDKLRKATQRLIGGWNNNDEISWSMRVCKAITRVDAPVVEAVGARTRIYTDEESSGPDADGVFYSNFHYVIKNVSSRTLAIDLIVLAGTYPVNQEQNWEDYVITDAVYRETRIGPGESGELVGRYAIPLVDSEKNSFVWQLPFDQKTLISATYIGEERPAPNCNAGWLNLGSSPIEQMAAALVRIGSAAKGGFGSIKGEPQNPGLSEIFFNSTVLVPGSSKVTIVNSGPNSSALISLYEGNDFKEATRVYEDVSDGLVKLCSTSGVKISANNSGDMTDRTIGISNLTRYSMATLSLKKRDSKFDTSGKSSYSVFWAINYAP
ncbi:hypothetical protein [Paraburkholderia caribensis]|uniref:hypothetical protein n=1 Tax=Paraburkholderia caribensis TaxID=75105 RepID=UPI0034D20E13